MDNNDTLIRLKNALDIKDKEMIEIFKLGGIDLTSEELRKILIQSKKVNSDEVEVENDIEENLKCDNHMLESFLNGFIIFKRGRQEIKPGETERPTLTIVDGRSVNNVTLKKLKIALSLSSDDMLNIFEEAGVMISKGELSSIFRKEGHKHYKRCADKYVIEFLNGLSKKNIR